MQELIGKIDQAADSTVDAVVDEILAEAADDILDALRAATPVRTGNAQAGWEVEHRPLHHIVDNDVEYITDIKIDDSTAKAIMVRANPEIERSISAVLDATAR